MNLFNTVTLIRHNGYITGLVLVNGESYEITPVENGEHVIAKINQSKFPQGQDTLIPPDFNRREWEKTLPPLTLNAAPSTIRVIVPVTQQVANVVQDVPGLVVLAFTLANRGALNSNAPVTFTNTSIFYTNYNENLSPTYQNLLERVGNVNDPVLGGPVNTRRVAERAHLIAMLVNRRDWCGMAWMPASSVSWGSSITTHTCINGHTFTHELGHNLDLDHDWANSRQRQNPPFRQGYRVNGQWRTILSYNCPSNCPRVNIFSTPNRTWNNRPAGTAAREDNVRRINEFRHTIVSFFPDNNPPPPPPPGNDFLPIVNQLNGLCLTASVPNFTGRPMLANCQVNNSNQRWMHDGMGRIRLQSNDNVCLSTSFSNLNNPVGFIGCFNTIPGGAPIPEIVWQRSNENFTNPASGRCLSSQNNNGTPDVQQQLFASTCNNTAAQHWLRG